MTELSLSRTYSVSPSTSSPQEAPRIHKLFILKIFEVKQIKALSSSTLRVPVKQVTTQFSYMYITGISTGATELEGRSVLIQHLRPVSVSATRPTPRPSTIEVLRVGNP